MVRYSKKLPIVLLLCMSILIMQKLNAFALSENASIQAAISKNKILNDTQNLLIPISDINNSKFKLGQFYNIDFDLWNDKMSNTTIVSPFDIKNANAQKSPINTFTRTDTQVYNVNFSNKNQQSATSDIKDEHISIKSVKKLIINENFVAAEKNLDTLEKGTHSAWEYVELANCYEKIQKTDKALRAYQEALAKSPDRLEILYSYATCLLKNNKLDLAENNLLKITKINPDFMLAYFDLGNLYYKKAEYRKAINKFNQSIAINPMCADAYYNTAVLLELQNRKMEAISYYKKYLALKPADAKAIKAMQKLCRS